MKKLILITALLIPTIWLTATDFEDGLIIHWTFEGVTENFVPDAAPEGENKDTLKLNSSEETGMNGEITEDAMVGTHALRTYGKNWAFGADTTNSEFYTTADDEAEFTLAAWIRMDTANSGSYWNHIITTFQWRAESGDGFSIAFSNNGAKAGFQMGWGDGKAELTGGNIVEGEWYHVAAVHDGSDAYLYLDGAQIATQPVSNYKAGGRPWGVAVGSAFKGIIDDVRLYNYGMDQDEVLDLSTFNVGVNDIKTNAIEVYPNPAKNKLFVSGGSISGVAIYNIAGTQVLSVENKISNPIDITALTTGIYLVKVTDVNGLWSVHKITVQ